MKIIIAGSKDMHPRDYPLMVGAMDEFVANSGHKPAEVVTGGARGADVLGERWGKERGLEVTCIPADWGTHGRGAGHERDARMVDHVCGGDHGALVALIARSRSEETDYLIGLARAAGLIVHLVTVDLIAHAALRILDGSGGASASESELVGVLTGVWARRFGCSPHKLARVGVDASQVFSTRTFPIDEAAVMVAAVARRAAREPERQLSEVLAVFCRTRQSTGPGDKRAPALNVLRGVARLEGL